MDSETISVSCSKPSEELLGLFEKVEKKAGVKTRASAFEACVRHWRNHGHSLDSLRSAIEYRPNINRNDGARTPSAFEIVVDKEYWEEAVKATKAVYEVTKIRIASVLSLYLRYMLLEEERLVTLAFIGDSSGLAWKFYGAYYDFEGSKIASNYFIHKPVRSKYKYKEGHKVSLAGKGSDVGNGPFAFIKEGNENLFELRSGKPKDPEDGATIENPERLAGNVDFNFCGMYRYFDNRGFVAREITKAERLIEIAGGSTPENGDIEAEVGQALKRSFEPWNHSLMLSTGKLQLAQSKGLVLDGDDHENYKYEFLDRPDSLVWLISRFYDDKEKWRKEYIERYCWSWNNRKKQWQIEVAKGNIKALMDYLKEFGDVYGYCKQVYGIDKSLTDKMIERGSKTLQNKDDVREYLQLARAFWDAREKSERGRVATGALLEAES